MNDAINTTTEATTAAAEATGEALSNMGPLAAKIVTAAVIGAAIYYGIKGISHYYFGAKR
jgi:hypothetical protein